MSWSYLPGQGDCLPANGLKDNERSVTWSETRMRWRLLKRELEMACWMMPLSGLTFAHLPSETTNADDSSEACGKFVTISLSKAASRASRSARPEKKNRMLTSAMVGLTPFALLERFDLNISSSKTYVVSYQQWIKMQMSLFAISVPFCETWPKAGMMHDGACYRRPKWEHRINGTGFGLLLPTPYANKHTSNVANMADLVDSKGYPWQPGRKPHDRRTGKPVTTTLHDFVRFWPTPTVNGNHNRAGVSAKSGDGLATAVNRWPTPRAKERKQRNSRDGHVSLSKAVQLFPTPTSSDANGTGHYNPGGGANLRSAIFRTPTASDATKWNNKTVTERLEAGHSVRLPNQVAEGKGGLLNPDWVELLMGWPMGWTAIEPLPIEAFVAWWDNPGWDANWERGVPRVVEDLNDRVGRLKVIGNGQVPLCALVAWELLMGDQDK